MPKRLGWVFIFIALLFFVFSILHILPFVAYVNIPIIAVFLILGIVVLLFGGEAQQLEPVKSEEYESDPDYYLKKFMPIWKRYTLFLKVFFAIPVLFIIFVYLMIIFDLSFIYLVCAGAIFTVTGLSGILYFISKLRCPKCDFLLTINPGFLTPSWELTGECPRCHVRLKNRWVSNDTARMIRKVLIAFIIALPFVGFVIGYLIYGW